MSSGDRARAAGEATASRRGYLSLGSNLGDRRANLQAAADAIGIRRSSHTYDTEPVGLITDQPEFLNVCVEIETELEPEALLDHVKAIERALGRTPAPRHAARVIDIDILLLGERGYRSERLQIPHAALASRRFVLVPLLELDGELRLPGGERLADALAGLGAGQQVRLAGPPLNV